MILLLVGCFCHTNINLVTINQVRPSPNTIKKVNEVNAPFNIYGGIMLNKEIQLWIENCAGLEPAKTKKCLNF